MIPAFPPAPGWLEEPGLTRIERQADQILAEVGLRVQDDPETLVKLCNAISVQLHDHWRLIGLPKEPTARSTGERPAIPVASAPEIVEASEVLASLQP